MWVTLTKEVLELASHALTSLIRAQVPTLVVTRSSTKIVIKHCHEASLGLEEVDSGVLPSGVINEQHKVATSTWYLSQQITEVQVDKLKHTWAQ
jgi:hypothetical protein